MHKLGEVWDVGEWEGITFILIYVSSLSWVFPKHRKLIDWKPPQEPAHRRPRPSQ